MVEYSAPATMHGAQGPQQLRQHRLGGLEVPPTTNNAGKPKAAEPIAVIKTTSDWDRVDEKLFASARATEEVPCVVVEEPTLNAPSWARHVSRGMQDAEGQIQADADNLRFAETDAGARRMAQMLPGGTVLPAFTPVQGTEVCFLRNMQLCVCKLEHTRWSNDLTLLIL